MTVAWIDTPGSALASKADAVDFTTSRAVVAISVRYGTSRAEERAYRDGAWLYPYLGSSGPVGGAAGTYRLVRAGGWPSKPTVHVDEAIDTLWDVLYEKDLTTLPTQSIKPTFVSQYATFTLDGQPWFFHGSAGTLMIVNGQGMVGGAQGGAHGGNPYAGLIAGLRVYAMTGYDATKAVAVQVRFGGAHASNRDVGAAHWSANEVWGYGPGNNSAITRWGYGDRIAYRVNAGTGSYETSMTSYSAAYAGTGPADPSETLEQFVFGAFAMPWDASSAWSTKTSRNWRGGLMARGILSSSPLPPIESMLVVGANNHTGGIAADSTYKMGFYLGSQPGTTTSVSAVVKSIRVLQKAV